MKTRFSLGHTTSIRGREKTYYVTFYQQPLRWRVIRWAYHSVWEKCTKRLFFKLERFVLRRDIPFSNRQDIRCHELSFKGRKHIGTIEITKEQSETLRGVQ